VSMPKEVFNLARISRSEEGLTAYFLYPSLDDAPDEITYEWGDGKTTKHTRNGDFSLDQPTSEAWWTQHVKNAEYPRVVISIGLFEDKLADVYSRNIKYVLS